MLNISTAAQAKSDPLVAVQRTVNLSVELVEERGGKDVWKVARIGGDGDCEDFALLKRKLLIEQYGFSPDDLDILLLVNPKTRTGHAVLAVRSQLMVLDIPTKGNKRANLKPVPYAEYLKKTGYVRFCTAGNISTDQQFESASDRCVKP
tara:strand:+ start:1224 stop:1670 length:447 start_codon:yes stop_codon:yes gene_type:complete